MPNISDYKAGNSKPDEDEEYVDQLMDVSAPDPTNHVSKSSAEALEPTSKPLDIFAGTKSPLAAAVPDLRSAPELAKSKSKKASPQLVADDETLSTDEANLSPDSDQPIVEDDTMADESIGTDLPADLPPDPADDSDESVDEAIDDITRNEGDNILKIEDQAVQDAFITKTGFWEKFRNGWSSWWGRPAKRYSTIAVLVLIIVGLAVLPMTRYMVLNTIGVRGTLSLKILDSTTNLPLKKVSIAVAGQEIKTDIDGQAKLSHLKLGKQTMLVHKTAFADITKQITVGMGSLNLGDLKLKAVGTQFTFNLTDYVTTKPIEGAQVTSGDASAMSDKTGKVILTVQPSSGNDMKVFVTDSGYRTDTLEVDTTSTKPISVKLVNSNKEVFISKQSGKYDLYSVYVDGKDRQVLLAGTGLESQDISLSVSPGNDEAALVSTRDNQRNADGYLLDTLTLINLGSGAVTTVDHSEQISMVGWSNGKFVYEAIAAGASAANPNRQRILAYDYSSAKTVRLASANAFNDVRLIGKSIYYATSSTGTAANPGYYQVNADNTGQKTIYKGEIWTVFRSDYGTLMLQASSAQWLNYMVGSTVTKATTAPSSYSSRIYVDNTNGSKSLWVDNRDGKGVLMLHDTASGKDTVITSHGGLNSALRWLDSDTVVYRVTDNQETADYVVGLNGTNPQKIVDVTGTYGVF
ncbi:MAG: hypothetical protein ABI220_00090 [Candidatus Saccharimonadales bacterium]